MNYFGLILRNRLPSSSLGRFFTLIVVLSFATSITYAQQTQLLSFWTNANCTGNAQFNSTAALTTHNVSGFPTIAFRANGLWAIEVCNSTTSCGTRRIAPGSPTSMPCTALARSTPLNSTWLRATRFGNNRQDEAEITFFTGIDFTGLSRVVRPPGANFTFSARSYFFTGMNRWEHKANATANNGTCLVHSVPVGNAGYGFTFAVATTLEIASVVHNCGNVPLPTTIRPTTIRPATGSTNTTQRTTSKPGGSSRNVPIYGGIILAVFYSIFFT